MTNFYNDINFFINEEDDDVYHLRCSTNGCINLPKKFIDKMNWKIGDEISMWEHSIHDGFGIGRDLQGLDLMKKEDRDVLTAHEDIDIKINKGGEMSVLVREEWYVFYKECEKT